MYDKHFSVEFLFQPMLSVHYLVTHDNYRVDQSLPLGDPTDVVCYGFHVSAPTPSAAVAICKSLLAEAVREDYHPDAFAHVVSYSCLVLDD